MKWDADSSSQVLAASLVPYVDTFSLAQNLGFASSSGRLTQAGLRAGASKYALRTPMNKGIDRVV